MDKPTATRTDAEIEYAAFEVAGFHYRTTLDALIVEAVDGAGRVLSDVIVSDRVRAAAVRAALGLDRPLTDADRKLVGDFGAPVKEWPMCMADKPREAP